MPACLSCNVSNQEGARFCCQCGAPLPQAAPTRSQPRRLPRGPSDDWLPLDDVLYTRDRRLGAIGAVLALFGAFLPWSQSDFSLFGLHLASTSVSSPYAWLIACAALASGTMLFRKQSGSVVMVIGLLLAAWTLLSAISGSASPSWGVALTLAGGGLLGYSGHLTNQYEKG